MDVKSIFRRRSASAGFTLIEMLVVISIVVLLVSLLLPTLTKARAMAQLEVCAANQRSIGVALGFYTNDYKVLPLMRNPGNVATNAIVGWATGTPEGLGRLLDGAYLGGLGAWPTSSPKSWPPAPLKCPGRDVHGTWDGTGSSEGDYATGWHSAQDVWWGGIDGQRLRHDGTGDIYNPPGSSWQNQPYYFSPTLNQYAVEWYREYTWTNNGIGGAQVLLTDTRGMFENPAVPSLPHFNMDTNGGVAALLTDLRVVTVLAAFDPTQVAPYGGYVLNSRPWQSGTGMEWWKWLDTKVPSVNGRNRY